MTRLLEEVFALARTLTEDQQDVLAQHMMQFIAQSVPDVDDGDDDFDRDIAATAEQLSMLVEEGRAAYRAGLTKELRPESL